MKRVSFLTALVFSLSFGLVSCSDKVEQAQEASEGTVGESVVELDTSTSQSSSDASAETANAQAVE